MNEKSSFPRKILYNDNLIRIFSLVAAVLFWFIVVINVSPDSKRTVAGVAVSVDENSSAIASLGLHVVDKSSSKVSISVTGSRNVIGKLSSSDFAVTPNLGVISKAGSYNLELSAVLKSPDNRVRITKINPAYITVRFDTLVTKTLPVVVKVEDGGVPAGYLMQTAVSNPTQITVSGPTSELSQVSKAVAYVNAGSKNTETTVVKSDVVLLDANSKQLTLDNVQLSNSSVEVTVPILKTRDVALTAGFTKVPKGFDTSNIVCKFTPATISLAGEKSKIDSTSEISLGKIDFTKLGLLTVQTLSIPDLDGLMNVENISSASVSIQLKNTATRTMNTTTFAILNQPSGYKVTNKTKQITGIKLFGPSSDLAKVTSIIAIIDMSGVQSGTGQYEVPVAFDVPGKAGYWVTGTYNAVVKVSKSSD
jgi:YbbR domain-containing protein